MMLLDKDHDTWRATVDTLATFDQDEQEADKLNFLRQARIPSEYNNVSISSYNVAACPENVGPVKQVVSWCEAITEHGWWYKHGLLITGPVKTGKTHLAVGALKHAVNNWIPSYFLDYTEMMARFRTQGRIDRDYRMIQVCFNVRLLVIDDFAAMKPSTWQQEDLMRLINHRYSNGRATIFTSNHDVGELEVVAGTRVMRRIEDATTHVNLTGGLWNMDGRMMV